MNRRSFLRSSVALGLAGLAPTSRAMARDEGGRFPAPPPLSFRDEKSDLKITSIRAVRLVPTRPLPEYTQTPGTWNTTEVEIANPLSIYPRFKPRRSLFYAEDLGPDTVMVETNKGITDSATADRVRPSWSIAISRSCWWEKIHSSSNAYGTSCGEGRSTTAGRGSRSTPSARWTTPSGISSARR